LKNKSKISKKLLVRLLFFIAAIGLASVLDIYLEKNPLLLCETEATSEIPEEEHGVIYLVTQGTNSLNAKTSVQKTPDRKPDQQSHDKFLQKYHQLRNYQVLKAEAKNQKNITVLFCHILIIRDYNCFFPDDDDPLIS